VAWNVPTQSRTKKARKFDHLIFVFFECFA